MKEYCSPGAKCKIFALGPTSVEATQLQQRNELGRDMSGTFHFLIFVLFTFFAVQGCTLKTAIETPEPTAFIMRPELLTKPKDLPFDLHWSTPKVSTWLFDTVIIKQVELEQVDENKWGFSAGTFITSKESYIESVFDLSIYLQKSIAKSFIDRINNLEARDVRVLEEVPHAYYNTSMKSVLSPDTPLPLYDPVSPGKRILLVELCLSEITFGDPLLYAGLFAVPVPGIANMSTSIRAPSMVMKARFVDQESGEVFAELVDRRFPQLKPVDLNRLVIGYALEEIADSFADDLARLFFRSRGSSIRKRSPISLLPW